MAILCSPSYERERRRANTRSDSKLQRLWFLGKKKGRKLGEFLGGRADSFGDMSDLVGNGKGKGEGKEKGKGRGEDLFSDPSAAAQIKAGVYFNPYDTVQSQSRPQQKDEQLKPGKSLLERIGTSATGLGRDAFGMGSGGGGSGRGSGEGLRGEVVALMGVNLKEGIACGSGSQSYGQSYAGISSLKEEGGGGDGRGQERGESVEEHVKRNEEEFSSFLDAVPAVTPSFTAAQTQGSGFESGPGPGSGSGFDTKGENTKIGGERYGYGYGYGYKYDDTSKQERGLNANLVRCYPQKRHDKMKEEWESIWNRTSASTSPIPFTSLCPLSSGIDRDESNTNTFPSTSHSHSQRPSNSNSNSPPANKPAIPHQENRDGEPVLAILDARTTDGELECGLEDESHGLQGGEYDWEEMWGLNVEDRRRIMEIIRGLPGLETEAERGDRQMERDYDGDGDGEWRNPLSLLPDYEREDLWVRARARARGEEEEEKEDMFQRSHTQPSEGQKAKARAKAKQTWKSDWEDVLKGYTDEVWGGLLPLVKEAREELEAEEVEGGEKEKREGTGKGERGELELKALRRLGVVLGHLRGSVG